MIRYPSGVKPNSNKLVMKLFMGNWWLTLSVIVKRIIKGALLLCILYGAFLFCRFGYEHETKGDASGMRDHSSFTIGAPKPWYHWEKTVERITSKTGSMGSMHTDSGFDVMTRSFGGGVLCLISSSLIFGIRRREKLAMSETS